jgi:hypothetical protein
MFITYPTIPSSRKSAGWRAGAGGLLGGLVRPLKMIRRSSTGGEYAGKLKVCKLNIDENQATPPKFGIRGIPTLMIFKNGNVEATKVGALSKSQLTAFVDSNI